MQSISFDPLVGDIATLLPDSSTTANLCLQAGATAAPLTSLVPAGGEGVSMQAAAAFAEDAAQMLALSQEAQLELARTAEALADIARLYTEIDNTSANEIVANPLARFRLANI